MESKVVWQDNMAFEAHLDGHNFYIDADPKAGGQNKGPRPKGLTLVSLAGCTAMDVISILQKMKQDVTQFEVKVHADRAEEHPKVFISLALEYVVTGKNIDRVAVEKAVDLSETRYCSAQAMLRKAVPIESRITIQEG